MKYVLDASVALRWVIPGSTDAAKAIRLRDDYLNKIHWLLAPDHFVAETANALTKAERQKLIPIGHAVLLFGKIASAWPVFHSYLPLTARAMEISSQTRSAYYDCLYMALAERERCEMVTADMRVVNNLQAQFPFVKSLASFP
jgi:predicted nucleic acid-binding protein